MNPYYDVFHDFTIIHEFDYELLYIFLTFMIYLRDQIKNSIEIPTLSQFLGHKMTYTKIYQFLTFDLLKRGQKDPKSKSCKRIRIQHTRKPPYTNFLKMYTKTRTPI